MSLMDGFIVTVKLATVALLITMPLGFLLAFLITSISSGFSTTIRVLIKSMYGMPIILVIPYVYYSLPVGTRLTLPIAILSVVGAGDLALRTYRFISKHYVETSKENILKTILVKSVNEWSRLVNITAFFSIMGIAEFARAAKLAMTNTGETSVLGFALSVYLLIHIITMASEVVLERQFLVRE